MALPNIALMGLAGAGKDTVAEYLAKTHQYTRIAFADPLKEMALRIDPVAHAEIEFGSQEAVEARLSELISAIGWEEAKRTFPEVRRFLRSLGAAMRDRDPDYWLNIALDKIREARRLNMPVVITDVRHQNEYQTLWECPNRFTMVRIDRPSIDTSDVDPESRRLIQTTSPDWIIRNDSTIDFLNKRVDFIINKHTT